MIDAWAENYIAGKEQEFPIVVINDLDKDWQGTIRFRLLNKGVVVSEKSKPCKVESLGKTKLVFSLNLPKKLGKYQVEAALLQVDKEPIKSLRDFQIKEKTSHPPNQSSIDKL